MLPLALTQGREKYYACGDLGQTPVEFYNADSLAFSLFFAR